jgi:hypothetical protein
VLEALQASPPVPATPAAAAAGPNASIQAMSDDLRQRWEHLRELLEGADSQALVLWHEAGTELSAALPPPAARALEDAMQRCDFQLALDRLPILPQPPGLPRLEEEGV